MGLSVPMIQLQGRWSSRAIDRYMQLAPLLRMLRRCEKPGRGGAWIPLRSAWWAWAPRLRLLLPRDIGCPSGVVGPQFGRAAGDWGHPSAR